MEVEIKLNVKPAVEGGPEMLFSRLSRLSSLAGYPVGPVSRHEIRDLYFDTPDDALARAGAGLRCRVMDGDAWVTLKVNRWHEGALATREEWEEPLDQDRLNRVLSHIRHCVGDGPFPAEAFAAGRPCGSLIPVLKVVTVRVSRPVGEVAELCLDTVEYPGLAPCPYFDIEVEAREGSAGEMAVRQIEEALYQLADGFLTPARESKLERGLRLRAGAQRQG